MPLLLTLLFLPAPAARPPDNVRCSGVQGNARVTPILCTPLDKNDLQRQIPGEVHNKTRDEDSIAVHRSSVQSNLSGDTLSVLFWNVENFFDWRNDSTTVSDTEFSTRGERHWTWKRFQAKANAFAKALFWVEGETGRLPDIIGLAEVENAFVLRQVLQKTALRKTDYRYVHYDSPDRRGIDVALLYRSSKLELLDSKPCHLSSADSLLATRDILLCVFRLKSSVTFPVPPNNPSVIPGLTGNLSADESEMSGQADHDGSGEAGNNGIGVFAVLVNHHPSKYGGAAESEPRRRVAVERLRFVADSLAAIGIDRIIAGGDFNDTPDNPVFRLLEPALTPLHMDLYRRGLGTIKYDGKWDLIDHFYISPAWMGSFSVSDPASVAHPWMRILRIPFLLTRDSTHAGEKPLRTYTGPRYTGGVSDHLPILLEIPFPP